MPDSVMTQAESVVTCATDVTNHIKALIECMDNAELLPDGFSETDDTSSDNEPDNVRLSVSSETKDLIKSEKRLSQSLGLKNGLFDHSMPKRFYRSKSKPDKSTFYHHVSKSTNNSNHDDTKGGDNNEHIRKGQTTTTPRHQLRHSHSYHQTRPHKYHHTHHGRHGNKKHGGDAKHNKDSEHSADESEKAETDSEFYSFEELAPIRAGQSDSDVNIPIITPPPPSLEERHTFSRNSSASCYSRPMSLRVLFAGEKVQCTCDIDLVTSSTKELLSVSVMDNSPPCFCSTSATQQDLFCGWEANKKTGRVKTAKRRKNARHNDTSFARLTQSTGKDPVIFHHYKDNLKYIERYRFYHTVGNVGRPLSYTKYEDKVPDSDPYFSRLKSNLTSVMNTRIYNLTSHIREDKVGSASSEGSVQGRARSDEESNEGSSVDVKACSMRDRGKALNLAPVRECTVPNLASTDKLDIIQLNQYLNLSTPPLSGDCIDFDVDDVKVKRYGYRLPNDSNIFATSGARRRARTLRLGSAEFVKPGTADSAFKWNTEKRQQQKSANNLLSTVPGNLIVGSTVSPIPSPAPRVKSNCKIPPYVQFQRENSTNLNQYPLQQISGQKVRTCERLTDTPTSGKERGKFSYTHAESSEKMSQPIRTATAVDFRETYIHRDRSRTITLDINPLGIRGQPLRQSEQMVLYKNRRAQSLRS
ncbi:hypothetical protein ACF0H5_016750 [Mactra antiquata]